MPLRIWGISIDSVDRTAVTSWLGRILDEPRYHRIATVNPEFLLLASENQEFRRVLFEADYRLMDGIGISLAALLRGEAAPERIPGTDILERLFIIADENKLPIFFAMRRNGLSSYQDICHALLLRYPDLCLDGADLDPPDVGQWISKIGQSSIVLCNFGAPEQEFFLAGLKRNPGAIRLAIGVGGALDYITAKVKRAPKLMRLLGLEWVWRLVLQPRRFRRIWRATIVFPFRLIFGKIDS